MLTCINDVNFINIYINFKSILMLMIIYFNFIDIIIILIMIVNIIIVLNDRVMKLFIF